MTSQSHSTVRFSQRIACVPLKPKRRFKSGEPETEHEPILGDAGVELKSHRVRMSRTGRLNVRWRRVTPPSELIKRVPTCRRQPLLAPVIDEVKGPLPRNSRGVWESLRC